MDYKKGPEAGFSFLFFLNYTSPIRILTTTYNPIETFKMQVSSFFLVAFSTLFAFATSSSLHRFSRADNTLPLPLKTVFQFSNIPTWIENLAVRENGYEFFPFSRNKYLLYTGLSTPVLALCLTT